MSRPRCIVKKPAQYLWEDDGTEEVDDDDDGEQGEADEIEGEEQKEEGVEERVEEGVKRRWDEAGMTITIKSNTTTKGQRVRHHSSNSRLGDNSLVTSSTPTPSKLRH